MSRSENRDRHRWRSKELESWEAMKMHSPKSLCHLVGISNTEAKPNQAALCASSAVPARGFLLEEQSMCHKELKMSRRGLRSVPGQFLTTLYQSLELSWPLKLILNTGNDLSSYSCTGWDWRFEGRGAVPPRMIPAAGRVGIDSFMVPLPHHGPHWGATQPQIQAEAQPCWGNQSMFWPKNTPSRKQNFPTRDVWRVCPAVRDLWSPA